MLLQSSLLVVINFTIMGSSSLTSLKKIIPIFNIVIAVTAIFMLVSFKKITYYIKRETELKLIKNNVKNTEEILILFHSQRHDYLGHIQAIGALAYLKEYDELSEYVQGISKEYRFSSEMIRLENPTLTALINIKKEIAEANGLLFHVKCKNKVSRLEMNPWELSSLISNLIENAIESSMISEGTGWIKFIVDYRDNNYIFEIENTGQIEESILENIFEPGISSKNSVARGYGLFIVRNIVHKYNGTVSFENTKQNSVKFTVTLPGEDNIYDKKTVS
jgi:two-component system sensor histidine kinase AgrC